MNKECKILQVGPNIHDDNRVGGLKTVVLVIAKLFPNSQYFSRSGVKGKPLLKALKEFFNILRSFRRTLSKNTIDIVHLHSALEKTAIIRDILFLRLARAKGSPILLHLHAGRFFNSEPEGIIKFLAGILLNSADRIIVLGEREKKYLKDLFSLENVFVLPNSINTNDVPLPAEKFNNELVRFIYLGRVDDFKGLPEIFKALGNLKEKGYKFTYTIYGSGPLTDLCREQGEAMLGDYFHYAGIVNGRAKWDALNNADIFLLPSEFEGLPMSLLEAMSVELVCITTAVGCIPEVIRHKTNGLITRPGNAEELEGHIRSVLDDPDAFTSLRKRAREDVFTNYNETVYQRNLRNIYDKMC